MPASTYLPKRKERGDENTSLQERRETRRLSVYGQERDTGDTTQLLPSREDDKRGGCGQLKANEKRKNVRSIHSVVIEYGEERGGEGERVGAEE